MKRWWPLLLMWGCAAHSKPTAPRASLTLLCSGVPHAIYQKPPEVFLVARFSDSYDLEKVACTAIEWSFGDGARAQRQSSDCLVSQVVTRYYHYHTYGEFRPAVYFRDQETGKVVAWAECAVSAIPPQP